MFFQSCSDLGVLKKLEDFMEKALSLMYLYNSCLGYISENSGPQSGVKEFISLQKHTQSLMKKYLSSSIQNKVLTTALKDQVESIQELISAPNLEQQKNIASESIQLTTTNIEQVKGEAQKNTDEIVRLSSPGRAIKTPYAAPTP